LKSVRAELYRKLGWCMIGLQQVELGMKWLASSSHITAPSGQLVRKMEKRRQRISTQALGMVTEHVVSQLLGPPDWEPAAGDLDESSPLMVGVGMAIGLEEDHLELVRSQLKDLVEA
jgi:hypothetical protein